MRNPQEHRAFRQGMEFEENQSDFLSNSQHQIDQHHPPSNQGHNFASEMDPYYRSRTQSTANSSNLGNMRDDHLYNQKNLQDPTIQHQNSNHTNPRPTDDIQFCVNKLQDYIRQRFRIPDQQGHGKIEISAFDDFIRGMYASIDLALPGENQIWVHRSEIGLGQGDQWFTKNGVIQIADRVLGEKHKYIKT
jgi:hypothetical protein